MLDLKQIRDTVEALEQPFLSLYLHVDNARSENQADTPAWRIELKNVMTDGQHEMANQHSRERWKKIEKSIDTFFSTYVPEGKSLALFTDGDTTAHYELPIPIESQSQYGQPLIMPLLWAVDEYERYLVVQIDRERARFISAYLGSASPQDEMKLELDTYDFGEKTLMPFNMGTQGGSAIQGQNRERYDSMIDAHVRRFYKDVIGRTAELMNEMKTRRFILSGDEQAAHTLRGMLPDKLNKHLIGVVPINIEASEKQVLNAVFDTATAYERQYESALVDEVIAFAKSGGRGALGHDDVTQALEQQRVETLIIPYPPREDGIADELKVKALRAGTEIELVHGSPAEKLEREGGVAARLYYTLP